MKLRAPFYALCCLAVCWAMPSCLDDDSREQDDTPLGVFEATWHTLDEHYCYFAEKGIDWDSVYRAYRPLFADSIHSEAQTLAVLDEMLDLLRDGHVNITSGFNVARYWEWYERYPVNFDQNLLDRYYLGTRYWISGGMKYGMMSDTIAYIRYESFTTLPGEGNLDYILSSLASARGLILDIRGNGGGLLTAVPRIASRFASTNSVYGYICHKTGPAHDAFSEPEPVRLNGRDPSHVYWNNAAPVVVLTNRHTYSAANNFVAAMRSLDGDDGRDVKIVGDRTGGGGGMPFSTVLPNGWTLRFSACPILDWQRRDTESGIEPDLHVDMDSMSMVVDHRDDIIETARQYIKRHTRVIYASEHSRTSQ